MTDTPITHEVVERDLAFLLEQAAIFQRGRGGPAAAKITRAADTLRALKAERDEALTELEEALTYAASEKELLLTEKAIVAAERDDLVTQNHILVQQRDTLQTDLSEAVAREVSVVRGAVWHPRETAPKDGRWFEALCEGEFQPGEPFLPQPLRWRGDRWEKPNEDGTIIKINFDFWRDYAANPPGIAQPEHDARVRREVLEDAEKRIRIEIWNRLGDHRVMDQCSAVFRALIDEEAP